MPELSIPPMRWQTNGMSMGFRRLKWLLLKEHNNHLDGTNKNEFKVCKTSRIYGRPDERIKPLDSGRTRRNCLEELRIHKRL